MLLLLLYVPLSVKLVIYINTIYEDYNDWTIPISFIIFPLLCILFVIKTKIYQKTFILFPLVWIIMIGYIVWLLFIIGTYLLLI